MTINGYQAEAMRTASSPTEQFGRANLYPLLLNGVMGLAGESGECVDMVKKFIFQGHDLDTDHLIKELGDVAWYLAVTAYALEIDLESVLQLNVDKLRRRYPDGFDPQRSIDRAEGDV